ncbi:MAG: hypothetical protein MI810_21675 [Flavobacteriales bacterium]|nr:hypothetical protein [Flavobacteriales bacterium]
MPPKSFYISSFAPLLALLLFSSFSLNDSSDEDIRIDSCDQQDLLSILEELDIEGYQFPNNITISEIDSFYFWEQVRRGEIMIHWIFENPDIDFPILEHPTLIPEKTEQKEKGVYILKVASSAHSFPKRLIDYDWGHFIPPPFQWQIPPYDSIISISKNQFTFLLKDDILRIEINALEKQQLNFSATYIFPYIKPTLADEILFQTKWIVHPGHKTLNIPVKGHLKGLYVFNLENEFNYQSISINYL